MRTGVVPVHKSRFRGCRDLVEQSADRCGGGKICRAVPEMIVKEFCRLPLDEFHGMAFLGQAGIRIPAAHQTGAGKEMKILPLYGNSVQSAHIEIEETAERMTLLDGDEKLFDRDFRGIQEKKLSPLRQYLRKIPQGRSRLLRRAAPTFSVYAGLSRRGVLRKSPECR